MKTYLVTRLDIYEQIVEVEAESPVQARYKAWKGDCEIHSDPEFKDFLRPSENWTVEEFENEK